MADPRLVVRGIGKSYPGVRALHDVSFDVRAGEIHALVGENGAGKSTLMRILAGASRPDTGSMSMDGARLAPANPAAALRHGIAMVYQDTRLVPALGGAANIFLGREPGRGPLIDGRRMRRDAAALAPGIDMRRPVGELGRAERQVIEIARAVARGVRVLILDEPTSALTAAETDSLFARLRALRAEGAAIVFISHRIPEILGLADRITVLKDGEVVGTLPAAQADADRLVAMMVGRSLSLAFPPRSTRVGGVVLQTADLRLHAGEILGLGGVQGSGQQARARALFGLRAETVRIDGRDVRLRGPRDAIAHGIIYVPADRRGESLFLPHSVLENVALPHLPRFARAGLLDIAAQRRAVAAPVAQLRVRTPSLAQPVGVLSGGNQQKVVFARWLMAKPKVYVLDEPTQGVDVETKLELYRTIRGLAESGAAIVVVSSDVLELIGLCDRIAVFAGGKVVANFAAAEATEEAIIGAATRHHDARAVAHRPNGTGPSGAITSRALLMRRYAAPLVVAALIALLALLAASRSPYFATPRTLGSLQVQAAPMALAALGQLVVILCGGIDLSVGPVASLVTCLASYVLADATSILGLAACLGAGLAVGGVNALLVQLLRVPDLIATLSTFSVVTGLALILRPAPGGTFAADLAEHLTGRSGGVAPVFLIVLTLFVVIEILLLRGRLGPRLYAAGSSPEAARLAGLPVGRIRAGAYVGSGGLAALAGLLLAARIGSGDPQAGASFTLTSVTAVAVGGASVLGGRGTAAGALLGAILIVLLQTTLNLLHVSAYWQYVVTGALTLAAVAAYSWRDATLGDTP